MSSTTYTTVFLVMTENKEGKSNKRHVKVTFTSQQEKEDSEADLYDTIRDPIQEGLNELYPGERITTTGDEDIEEEGDVTNFDFKVIIMK